MEKNAIKTFLKSNLQEKPLKRFPKLFVFVIVTHHPVFLLIWKITMRLIVRKFSSEGSKIYMTNLYDLLFPSQNKRLSRPNILNMTSIHF